ncbi:protein kilB (plasmid) [Streptomyces sp. NEAU-sy36]|uniref:protein kilB n=1 Tax=unclassified Streptomyces TaxID=2593676 RepID=UPI0015D61849|nr:MULTISPECIES: protein kilB [unclassified Streptomyces]QLJ06689.1 protein kilB [Streptomyces sp. NEAU-sy36]
MITAIVAVLGTLAGALLTGLLQHRTARAEREAATAETRRAEALAAVTELVSRLADHRRAMWVREDLRLRGEDWSAARAESHSTRSAITAPLLRVQMLLPSIAPAAQAAAQAAYDIRGAVARDVLDNRRDIAITASDRLTTAAATALNA